MEYDSKKRARAVYRQKHDIVRVVLDMPASSRDLLRSAACASGFSLTRYILQCCGISTGSADAPTGSADAPTGSADAPFFF